MNTEPFSQQSLDYQIVEGAIGYIEANYRRQPNLEEIARHVHLSKYHFQRLFKRWAGVSPTQFMRSLSVEHAKAALEASQSVLEAALEAGLSGPGRLHDLFVTYEGVSPGEYKREGAGLRIACGRHATPFGQCLLALTERGICGLMFSPPDLPDETMDELERRWPGATLLEDPDRTAPLIERIFGSSGGSRPFHLLLKGTNFQINVWRALLHIPPGALVSYSGLAAGMGRTSATRAVAGAVARNPIAYLIPCHRVITKGGTLHQYRWGTARKKAMVGWEAAH